MRAELNAVAPDICVIDEIDLHDFCNRVLIPAIPGTTPFYLSRGLGCSFSNDGDDPGDGEPLAA